MSKPDPNLNPNPNSNLRPFVTRSKSYKLNESPFGALISCVEVQCTGSYYAVVCSTPPPCIYPPPCYAQGRIKGRVRMAHMIMHRMLFRIMSRMMLRIMNRIFSVCEVGARH